MKVEKTCTNCWLSSNKSIHYGYFCRATDLLLSTPPVKGWQCHVAITDEDIAKATAEAMPIKEGSFCHIASRRYFTELPKRAFSLDNARVVMEPEPEPDVVFTKQAVDAKVAVLVKEITALEKENARLREGIDDACAKADMITEKVDSLLSVSKDWRRRELELRKKHNETNGKYQLLLTVHSNTALENCTLTEQISKLGDELGGKYRPLEAGEKILSSDEIFFIDSWVKVDELEGIGDMMKRAMDGELTPEFTPTARRKIIKG